VSAGTRFVGAVAALVAANAAWGAIDYWATQRRWRNRTTATPPTVPAQRHRARPTTRQETP
jgi:hypothetical protein